VVEAVPIIMGSNIGTTVTNMLVSVVHVSHRPEFRRAVSTATLHDFFNILTVAILFPVELLTGYLARTAGLVTQLLVGVKTGRMPSPLSVVVDPGVRLLQQWVADVVRAVGWGREVPVRVVGLVLVGVAVLLLFSSLLLLVKTLRSVLAERMEGILDRYLFTSTGRSLLVGLVLTLLVQSSGVTTSLMVPLGAAGLLTLERVFPYTMGTNIGTTVTAILASLATDSPEALTIALVHTIFNVTGVTLMLTIRPLRQLPIYLARKMGDAVMRNRAIVLVYIVLVFYVIPGMLVFLGHWLGR
jgi:sodium-dependent phosphate cotransporter